MNDQCENVSSELIIPMGYKNYPLVALLLWTIVPFSVTKQSLCTFSETSEALCQ